MSQVVQVRSIVSALIGAQDEIARRWLERISARVAVEKDFVFPSEDILDEVPLLIEGIGRHLGDERREISVDTPVVEKARELGRLRHAQGFSARQILWEYEVLGAVILEFVDSLDGVVGGAAIPEALVRRLFRALSAVQRVTMEEFLGQFEERVHEREDRLRGFNRALSHELKNQLGVVLGAARMLQEPFVCEDTELRERFVGMVVENGERMERLIQNLRELTAVDVDTRQHRNVLLPHAAAEVARQLRAYAEANGVEIEILELPALEVNAAVVDLTLTNLVANGVKYHDPGRPDRRVRIQPAPQQAPEDSGHIVVEVVDNGRGVAEEDRPHLFDRFFRGGSTSEVEGSGLGLSLVRDALERVGGSVWVDFPPTGETVFAFSLPARRVTDP